MIKALEKARSLTSKMIELRKELNDCSRDLFEEAAKEVFAANPELENFSWAQYTPYFNDGDPCRFRASTDYPSINMCDEAENEDRVGYGEDDDGQFSFNPSNPKYFSEDEPATQQDIDLYAVYERLKKSVLELLNSFDDAAYQTMFGDGYRITVNRDGTIDEDEYSHD
jgi:hypothetical protein